MQYFYAILWFAVGLILIFSLSKENRIFLFAGGFFLLLGAWWLADALLPEVDDQSASQHWNIMVAILANDPERAEQSMRSHMQYVTRLYSRELDRGHL